MVINNIIQNNKKKIVVFAKYSALFYMFFLIILASYFIFSPKGDLFSSNLITNISYIVFIITLFGFLVTIKVESMQLLRRLTHFIIYYLIIISIFEHSFFRKDENDFIMFFYILLGILFILFYFLLVDYSRLYEEIKLRTIGVVGLVTSFLFVFVNVSILFIESDINDMLSLIGSYILFLLMFSGPIMLFVLTLLQYKYFKKMSNNKTA